ncbi:MAG: hypothetical protein ACO1O3_05935 [Sphingobium sp.]
MSRPVIAASAVLLCLHGGRVVIAAANARVLAGGAPIVTIGDDFPVSGCANVHAPCIRIEWPISATRVRVGGRPPILQGGVGLALSAQGNAGTSMLVSNQVRVTMR